MAVAAFVLIFLIMLFITRSLMAALVIPGTAFSYAGAFGLSILVWQHLIGLRLHWLILRLTFIILVEFLPSCAGFADTRSGHPGMVEP